MVSSGLPESSSSFGTLGWTTRPWRWLGMCFRVQAWSMPPLVSQWETQAPESHAGHLGSAMDAIVRCLCSASAGTTSRRMSSCCWSCIRQSPCGWASRAPRACGSSLSHHTSALQPAQSGPDRLGVHWGEVWACEVGLYRLVFASFPMSFGFVLGAWCVW